MILAPGTCARTPATICLVGCDAPALELVRRQTPAQVSKICTTSAPASNCRDQIVDRGLDQTIDQPRESFRIAIGEQPRRRLVGRAMAGDHVGRDRPRRAAEADQRRLRRQRRFHPPHRLIDRRQHCRHRAAPRSAISAFASDQRLEPRAFALDEPNLAPERKRHDQNIGKQNRRIEAEAPHRLQRHFGGKFRIEAEIEKAAGFLPHRTIFRQIASRLPHHPDRRHCFALAVEHAQQRLYPHELPFERLLP